MTKQLFLLSLAALGFCEASESKTLARARGTSGGLSRYMVAKPLPLGFRTVQRDRRHSHRGYQTLVMEDRAPASVSTAEVKKHRFSGVVVQVAAGLNAGYAQTPGPQTGTTRNAMAFSVMFEKKLDETFYLCPELSYVQRGVTTNLANVGGITVAGSVQLNYLEIPLLLKAKVPLTPRLKAFIVGGPWAGLILSRQVEILGLINGDLSQRFKQADFGVLAGVGLEYQVNPDFAVVGHLRNTIGLVNIDSSDSTFFTRGIQLLIGAQFQL